MKEAIQKAIREGWKPRNNPSIVEASEALNEFSDEQIALATKEISWSDPLFWQALGKALGWEGTFTAHYTTSKDGCSYTMPEDMRIMRPIWEFQMLRFISYLAEGKDAESFFNDMIKQSQP